MSPAPTDRSLYEVRCEIPDPRHRRGKIYPLGAVLTMVATDLEQRVVAIDGKTLRGSQGHQLPGVHLLAAYRRDVEAVIAQLRVSGKTNEHKTALELLKLIPLKGTLTPRRQTP
jgi:hypothetical protein